MAITAKTLPSISNNLQRSRTAGYTAVPKKRQTYKSTQNTVSGAQSNSYNNGGLWSGLGYLSEKVGLGFLSGIEGIWDYSAGGIAKMFGADDWAEQQFDNDWVNYSHADEWFNPSDGWQVAGDVAGGIGTSLPALAGVATGAAITYFSGGTAAPAGAKIIAASLAPLIGGLGAAGNATKEAYRESGSLGGKEFGYGALVGATEAGIELATQGIGTGSGRIGKALLDGAAGKTAKEFTETLVKVGGKSVLNNIATDFASEAFEEGVAEFLSPYYKRWTYDPDAENATPRELAYASLVGGLSGAIMSGGGTVVNTASNLISGERSLKTGVADKILHNAKQITATENANDTGYDSYKQVKEVYEQLTESLNTTNGTIQNTKQKMLLGQLKRATTVSVFMPFVEREAINLLYDSETVAQRYNEFGMKDSNGKKLTFSAEQIRSGVDQSLIEKAKSRTLTKTESRTLTKQIRSALKSNSTLTTLAVASATGHITMNTQRFAEAALNGEKLASTADLNYFAEHASKEQIEALSADLGISDWSSLTAEEFRSKVADFAASGKLSEYAKQSKRIRAAAEAAAEAAKPVPHILRGNMSDGIYRFSSENNDVNMAVFKEGETYHLFDYESGNISRALTVKEVNKVLRSYWNSNTAQTPTVEQFSEETNLGRQTLNIDAMARAQIPEYHKLSEPNKQAVRATIRQAQANGIAEAETLTFARVAARSGMNIVFDGAKSAVDDANIQGNTIYINPNAPKERLQSRLLLHEAGHALLRSKDGKNLIAEAFRHIAPERSQEIAQRYINFYKKQGMSMEQYMPIVNEEITTAYIEDVLGDANAWEYILGEDPSLSEKVLSFFRKAARDYSADEKLSAEARKLLRTYKKLFADLSAQNQGNNALELSRQDEREKAPSAEVKAQRRALPDSIGAYSDEERKSIEARKDNITASSYDDVLEFFEYSISDKSNEGKTMFVGKISSKTAAKIHKATGLNAFNKSIALNSHDLRHMMKEHGDADSEAMRNQEAITVDNFEYVIETIADPDEVTSEKDEKSGVLSLIFKKDIAGKTTAITIFSEKRKTLTLKTAWIIKKEQHISQPTNAEALIRTPEARSSMDTVPTDSIPQTTAKSNTSSEKSSEKSSDRRYALAGEKAETADKLKLATAEQMLKDGADSETVRQETGWFRGYDGKWRFEIDDSKMKLLTDNIEQAGAEPQKLEDIMRHDELFRAYPELREITVIFKRLFPSTLAESYPWDNKIILSSDLRSDISRLKRSLLHEIQHTIQYIEGFATGSSPEHWRYKPRYGKEEQLNLTNAEKRLKSAEKEILELQDGNIKLNLAKHYTKFYSPRLFSYMPRSKEDLAKEKVYIKSIEKKAKAGGWSELLYEYAAAESEYRTAKKEPEQSSVLPNDLYERTAGEIEARDVSSRSEMDSEQRKNIRPNIDRTDVVFREDSVVSHLAEEQLERSSERERRQNAQAETQARTNEEKGQVTGEKDNKLQITAEMSDRERASVLRNRTLTAPIYKDQADSVIEDVKRNYEREKKAFGKKAIVEIAEKLGIISETINFDDVDIKIELSKSNLRESVVKEANPAQIAKLLPILSQTAKYSVVVERHNNRYYYDTDTEHVDNLMGAYVDGNDLVPVRFGLKHSKTGKTTLYVLVDQNKISLENLDKTKNDRGLQDASSDFTESNDLHRSVIYSIPQILSFVNSKDLLRYIPDDFLDFERIAVKKKAIAETEEYTDRKNDEKYAKYVEAGKTAAAKQMLSVKAKAEGYKDVDAEGKSSDITYDNEQKLIPISKRYDRNNPDRRYALPDEDIDALLDEMASDKDDYSYETLTQKNDLAVVTFPTELPMTENGKVNTNAVVARGRLNARKQKNPNNTETSTYVRVDDIGLDVLLSKSGMTHGIARSQETAFAVMKIGDVLKNSVAVNELNGSATRKTEMSYVLLGACRDSENLYVVRSVVSKLENDVTEIDVYQLSAVKGKKTETPTSALGGTAVTEQSSLISSESPVVSIADFLEYVKTISLSNEVFSEDVAKKLGVERSKGTLSGDIRYALPEGEDFASPTLSTVAKDRVVYKEKAFSKEWRKTKAESAYIHAVDEMFGVQTYLEKVGKTKNAKATIHNVRSAPHQAQSMVGSVQYNIFESDAKSAQKMGEGLNEIFRPIERKGEKAVEKFNDYLLHQLNVDKYDANERMKKSQEDTVDSLHKLQDDIKSVEDQIKALEDRIFELGDTDAEKKLKQGNRKAIDDLQKKLLTLKYDETELLLKIPMHAEAELEAVNKRISKLMIEKSKIKQEIFDAGNSEDAMAKKKELKEKSREIDDNIAKEKALAGKLGEIARLYDYSLKPVFFHDGKTYTRNDSIEYIKKYEAANPEFRETAEKVWRFNKNLNKMRVSAQLISESFANKMATMYPHYVPSFKSQANNSTVSDEGVSVSSTVKKAKGYNNEIVKIKDSIAAQVSGLARNGNINILANKVYDTASQSGDTKYVDIGLPDDIGVERSTEGIDRPKPHTITFFKNGNEYKMNVSDEIYAGFKGISEASAPHSNVFARAANWVTDKYKKLVTSYSPAFMIRNAIRDLQDAGINSKHPALFAKNIPKAWRELGKNSKNWETFRAYGGFSSSVFDTKGVNNDVGSRGFESLGISEKLASEKGLSIKDVKYLKALFKSVGNMNAAVEVIPRFAEYLASIEAGETIEQAIYNSAEVTTNFARRGATTKALNSTIIPFLNPAIQGFDKIFRNFTDAAKAGNAKAVVKSFGTLLVKAITIGMLPMLFNSLMYDDDEEYKDLREEDKENNYLFKLPNGTFLKLPRGRVASVIGGLYNRTAKTVKGEDADWKGYASNVVSQVTPVENLTRTIFSPWMDVATNRTWYGTEIEGAQFDNVRPRDRYDESTSSIAIAIGQTINYSPKKIHYLIDQYSGVIGDFILPATTSKAEKDFFSGNFTLDPATSNKLSTQFNEIYKEAQYSKSDNSITAQYQVKYLNKVKDSVSELYDQINAIQSSDLSSNEKLQQVRVIRIMINEAYKNAIADYDSVTKAIEDTANMGFDDSDLGQSKQRYAEITKKVYGSERALKEYNDDVYAKMSVLNKAGVSYDKLYDYYFTTKDIQSDVDRYGNAVSGSKRKKVVAAINALGLSPEKKLLLICAKGYSLQDGDLRGLSALNAKKRLLRYILRLGGKTQAEKAALAELCGFEVKNGRVITKIA